MCPLFFIKSLFFHQMIALQKLWKMFFISSKKLFFLFKFLYFCRLLFFSLSTIALQVDQKKILSLRRHQLSKKELNNIFCVISWEGNNVWRWNLVHWWNIKWGTSSWQNHAENVYQKLVPDPFLILLCNLKQPLHARYSFKNKVFWKKTIKKP